MRLIDADKVEFKLCTPIEDENGIFRGFKSVSIVANEPTIDAIPVEWIKMWCLKHYPAYQHIVPEYLLKETETWRMIEDWEKENETN